MRRCVWSRNLVSEGSLARVGPQRQRGIYLIKKYKLINFNQNYTILIIMEWRWPSQPQLYSCNNNVTLKMAAIPVETCWWEYCEYNVSLILRRILFIMYIYTGCNRRKGPDFGRVFLMLNYTDITQNTYIQSWTFWEIMASEVWNFDSGYTLTDYQIHIETGRNVWFL